MSSGSQTQDFGIIIVSYRNTIYHTNIHIQSFTTTMICVALFLSHSSEHFFIISHLKYWKDLVVVVFPCSVLWLAHIQKPPFTYNVNSITHAIQLPVYVVINSDCSLTFRFTQRHPVIHILLLLYLLVTPWRCCSFVTFSLLSLYQDPLHIQLIKSRPRHTLVLLAFANKACLLLHNNPKELFIQLLGYRQTLMTKMLTTLTASNEKHGIEDMKVVISAGFLCQSNLCL